MGRDEDMRMSETKKVLLLGAIATVVEDVRQQLQMSEIEFIGGTSVDDVLATFAQADINHVIIGGGLDLETRLNMVRQVFQASDLATVHMKDQISGPEGFLPFVRSVLIGLNDYEPHEQRRAILRAHRPPA
jgi:hypothetical protein